MTQHQLQRRRRGVGAFAFISSLSLAVTMGALPAQAQPTEDAPTQDSATEAAQTPAASEEAQEIAEPRAPEETAAPEATSDAEPTETPTDADAEGAEEQPAPVDEGEEPTEDALDKYYPELAKKMFDADGDGKYKITEPVEGGKGAGNIAPGLEKFYNQKVDFSPENCEALGYRTYEDVVGRKAECGYMIAPIDVKDASKGNIAIAVMKVKSGKLDKDGKFTPTKAKGSVMWNPGGPGGSGMTMSVAGAKFDPELAEDFDMIGFDPRGTGSSMPFSQCSSDKQVDKDRESNSFGMDRDAAEEDLNNRAKRYTDDCFSNTGKLFDLGKATQEDVMKHLGTWDAVGDLDLLRSITGDDKLNYVGFSYGTRLGYVYAQKYGANVGKLVLDGVVDPGNVDKAAIESLKQINQRSDRYLTKKVTAKAPVDDSDFTDDQKDTIAQGAGFQGTFEQFALDCSEKGAEKKTYGELWPEFAGSDLADQPFSCALGDGITDTKKLTEANAKLLQTLETSNDGKGLPTGQPNDNRMVSFADGRQGAFQALYSESLWSQLNVALNELKAGKSAGGLMILADQYMDRDENGHYAPMLQAFTNIRCTDSNSKGDEPSKDLLRRFAQAYDDAAPFQAATVAPGVYDYCDFWKFKGTLPGPEKLTKVPNILVISTSHDSATPYDSGVKLARLIDGTLLSVSGASHTSFISGEDEKMCVDETVNDFFKKGTVPEDGDFGAKLKKPDTAKDDLGNTVTFNTRCKVETFRESSFSTSTSKAHAGEKIGFMFGHYTSEAEYSVRVGDETVATAKSDNGGNGAGTFTLPESLEPGNVKVSLVDAKGKVLATRDLEIMKKEKPKEEEPETGGNIDNGKDGSDKGGSDKGGSSDEGDGKDGSDKDGSDKDGSDTGGSSDEGGSDKGQDGKGSKDSNANGSMPRTGTELGFQAGIALILVATGAGAVVVARKRRQQ